MQYVMLVYQGSEIATERFAMYTMITILMKKQELVHAKVLHLFCTNKG